MINICLKYLFKIVQNQLPVYDLLNKNRNLTLALDTCLVLSKSDFNFGYLF